MGNLTSNRGRETILQPGEFKTKSKIFEVQLSDRGLEPTLVVVATGAPNGYTFSVDHALVTVGTDDERLTSVSVSRYKRPHVFITVHGPSTDLSLRITGRPGTGTGLWLNGSFTFAYLEIERFEFVTQTYMNRSGGTLTANFAQFSNNTEVMLRDVTADDFILINSQYALINGLKLGKSATFANCLESVVLVANRFLLAKGDTTTVYGDAEVRAPKVVVSNCADFMIDIRDHTT